MAAGRRRRADGPAGHQRHLRSAPSRGARTPPATHAGSPPGPRTAPAPRRWRSTGGRPTPSTLWRRCFLGFAAGKQAVPAKPLETKAVSLSNHSRGPIVYTRRIVDLAMTTFTPLSATLGGILIGIAATLLWAVAGRT